LVAAEGTTIASASGACEGEILHAERGAGGFGYDPIFLPRGQTLTMAELPSEAKNRLSHRGVAARELVERLRSAR
jgi:XTP/dITP diphosphohydrolase